MKLTMEEKELVEEYRAKQKQIGINRKNNINERGMAITCLWCDERPTRNDHSNTCQQCLDVQMVKCNLSPKSVLEKYNMGEVESHSTNILKIYDKI